MNNHTPRKVEELLWHSRVPMRFYHLMNPGASMFDSDGFSLYSYAITKVKRDTVITGEIPPEVLASFEVCRMQSSDLAFYCAIIIKQCQQVEALVKELNAMKVKLTPTERRDLSAQVEKLLLTTTGLESWMSDTNDMTQDDLNKLVASKTKLSAHLNRARELMFSFQDDHAAIVAGWPEPAPAPQPDPEPLKYA